MKCVWRRQRYWVGRLLSAAAAPIPTDGESMRRFGSRSRERQRTWPETAHAHVARRKSAAWA
jgi:hypothetical protein